MNVLSPAAACGLMGSFCAPRTAADADHARSICNAVGYLPLAVTLAGSYLKQYQPGESKVDRPFARAFNWLHCLSLAESLESDGGAARLHPLVREFSLQLVPEDERVAFRRAAARSLKEAHFDYPKLESDVRSRGIRQVLDDLKVALDWWGRDGDEKRDLELLEGALRLSADVLAVAPDQLPAQLWAVCCDEESPRHRVLSRPGDHGPAQSLAPPPDPQPHGAWRPFGEDAGWPYRRSSGGGAIRRRPPRGFRIGG